MSLTPLTAPLPTLAGTLPDLFRRSDNAAEPRASDTTASLASSSSRTDEHARTSPLRGDDDSARVLARHRALGPLTYGRSFSAAAPAAVPLGMRGANLDVRG